MSDLASASLAGTGLTCMSAYPLGFVVDILPGCGPGSKCLFDCIKFLLFNHDFLVQFVFLVWASQIEYLI